MTRSRLCLLEEELRGIQVAGAHEDPVGDRIFGHIPEVVLHDENRWHGTNGADAPQVVGLQFDNLFPKLDLLGLIGRRFELIEQLQRLRQVTVRLLSLLTPGAVPVTYLWREPRPI